mmetsp:Transcript_7038/g.17101  ORF Transcript_7038/g.17101 Transcript_7038/m.17101 type:complete len:84 (-) Transcript_7038:731-982(-)
MLASKPSESASVKNAYKRRKVCSRSSSRCSARKWVWTKNYRTARLLRQHWAKLEHAFRPLRPTYVWTKSFGIGFTLKRKGKWG